MQALRQAQPRVASRGAAGRTLINPTLRAPLPPSTRGATIARRAIELDFSDPDTQLSVAGVVLGLVFGLGAPIWYASRADRDEELLEEVRALNRANYEATGEYLSEVSVGVGASFFLGSLSHPRRRLSLAAGSFAGGDSTKARLWRRSEARAAALPVSQRQLASHSRSLHSSDLTTTTPKHQRRRRSRPSASPSGRTAASSSTTTKQREAETSLPHAARPTTAAHVGGTHPPPPLARSHTHLAATGSPRPLIVLTKQQMIAVSASQSSQSLILVKNSFAAAAAASPIASCVRRRDSK
jgi:hypothetical protein